MKIPEKILYAHEHTAIDLSGPKNNIDCRLDDFDATVAEYRHLVERGVVSIIDQTNRGMGRNVAYTEKVAAAAGVKITHATGYYKEPFLPPECYALTEQQLSDIMVRELTVGIEDTGIRAELMLSAAGTAGSNGTAFWMIFRRSIMRGAPGRQRKKALYAKWWIRSAGAHSCCGWWRSLPRGWPRNCWCVLQARTRSSG